ncbi:hypothetical protein CerSpe_208450 [Prunus speciosa]
MSELKKHGGKISVANKILIPATEAVKFPDLEVNYSDGKISKLPIGSSGNGNVAAANKAEIPKASLVCLSFRASSQGMIHSWSAPFLDAFSGSKDVQLYEVSLIDSWFLCRSPIKKLLLRIMRKSKHDESIYSCSINLVEYDGKALDRLRRRRSHPFYLAQNCSWKINEAVEALYLHLEVIHEFQILFFFGRNTSSKFKNTRL